MYKRKSWNWICVRVFVREEPPLLKCGRHCRFFVGSVTAFAVPNPASERRTGAIEELQILADWCRCVCKSHNQHQQCSLACEITIVD